MVHRPHTKENGGDVVIVAGEDWEAIQETLHVQSIPGAGDFKELEEISPGALAELISDQA